MRSSCNQLGCLTPLRNVVSPTNSISINASRDVSSLSSSASRLSVTISSSQLQQQGNTPSSILPAPQESSVSVRGVERSSLQSTRQSSGFQSSGQGKRSKAESVKEIPTDFQLNTTDGPVPLVMPRTPAPVDMAAPGAPSPTGGTSPVFYYLSF